MQPSGAAGADHHRLDPSLIERRLETANIALERSHEVRKLVADLAARMVDGGTENLDPTINAALEHIARFTHAEAVFLFRFSDDAATMRRTHEWPTNTEAFRSALNEPMATDPYPLWRDLIVGLQPVRLDSVTAACDHFAAERAALSAIGVQSLLAIPLVRDGHAVGFLGVETRRFPRTWTDDDVELLNVAANLLGSGLARRDAELIATAADERLKTVTASSSDAIIIIDATGLITQPPIGEELFGYTADELLNQNALDLVHPDDLDFAAGELLKAALDPTYHAINPMRIRHAAGHWIPIELKAFSRFHDPAINGIIMNVRDVSDRLRTEEQLRASEARFGTLIENLPGAVYRCEPFSPYHDEYVSPTIEQLTGWTAEDFVSRRVVFDELLLDGDRDRNAVELSSHIETGNPLVTEYPIRHRDGTIRWISEHCKVIGAGDGTPLWLEGVLFDITARVDAEAQVARSEEWLHTLIANVPGAVFRTSAIPPYTGIFLSDAIEDLTGYPPGTPGSATDLYSLITPSARPTVDAVISRAIQAGEPYSVQYQIRHRDGTLRWIEERGEATIDEDGTPLWIDGVMIDTTSRKQLEEQLVHDAAHDPLTGLPNRVVLIDHLDASLARLDRTGGIVAVLFIDLDRFKLVNDALGHAAGDQLLVYFSERLRAALRPSDLATRSGGDEFVVVCTDLTEPAEAEAIATRLAAVLQAPFHIEGREMFVTASVGIAIAVPGTASAELLRDADAAAYQAKERGRNRYEIFDEQLRAATATALETESALHRALDDETLFLRYQPVVELAGGRVIGVEGLIRWQHPERGVVTPEFFLPAAEASGLIVKLGRRVLQLAVGALSTVPTSDVGTLAINLSPRELVQPDLVECVRVTLADHNVDPRRLCIEITETAVLEEPEVAIATMHALRDLGLRLAIDDFGTGYSSLSYLRRLPVDIVKIDRSFTSELGRDDANTTIVAGIIGLGHGLGLQVIAEGIETERQAEILMDLGCAYGQGFLYSPPVPLDELLAIRNTVSERNRLS